MNSWDPIALGILWSRLTAIADEAAATLTRTSFSTVVREAHDYALILLDPNGDAIAENSYGLVAFVTTMPVVMKNFLKQYPLESWRPGDIALTNNPWFGLGHVLDLGMAAPVFYQNRLVAFVGSIAHVPDIGGVVWGADARDVFEEGLNIPVCKLYESGRPNKLVFDFLRANSRLADQLFGDLEARRAAGEVAGRRLVELLEAEGLEDLRELAEALFTHSEMTMRKAIRCLPPGVYRGSAEMDGVETPLRLEAAITVEGDSIVVDYSGTSAQVDAGFNIAPAERFAMTVYPLKCALDPETPRTSGSYRPFVVTAPLGTLLNPRFPAATNARQITGHFIHAALFQALAPVIPNQIMAPCGSPHMQVVLSGRQEDGRPFTALIFDHPGMGGRAGKDGLHSTHYPGNAGSTSIEVIENSAPLLVHERTLICDSGGPGRFRGGCGIQVTIENRSKTAVQASILGDRVDHPAPGILGGLPGATASVEGPDGAPLPSKGRTVLRPGEVVRYREAGGGGYGPPSERERSLVDDDIRNGLVSADAALAVRLPSRQPPFLDAMSNVAESGEG